MHNLDCRLAPITAIQTTVPTNLVYASPPKHAELEVAEHVAVSRDDAEWMQWLEGDIGGALNAYGHLRLNEIVHFLGRLDPESSRNDALHGSA